MLKKYSFYPILFSLFPIFSLYLSNSNKLLFINVVWGLAWTCFGMLILGALIYIFLRNVSKTAFIVGLFVFIFFSFRSLLTGIELFAYLLGFYEKSLSIIESKNGMVFVWLSCILLWVLLSWRIIKGNWELPRITYLLNIVSLSLVLVLGFTWLHTYLAAGTESSPKIQAINQIWVDKNNSEKTSLLKPAGPLPDIYYIILDGYARSDILQSIYGGDNTEFLDYLQSKGFFIATQATTNYQTTPVSITSSLNYEYIDDLVSALGPDSKNITPLYNALVNNRVFTQLHRLGYRTVTFSTGYGLTEIPNSDIVLTPGNLPNDYENVLIGNTPLSFLLLSKQYDWHRQRILYTINHLSDAADMNGPFFVFAHIVAPHPPFVFDRSGHSIYPDRAYSNTDANDFMMVGNRDEYIKGYRDQLTYISSLIDVKIDEIIKNSRTPPIIILQSDHGPGLGLVQYDVTKSDLRERFSILNAYYLPGINQAGLYPGITPVNTFRIVFNVYFGANYPLLEDRNFFSPTTNFYSLTDVTNRVH